MLGDEKNRAVSESSAMHKEIAAATKHVQIAIVTVSDSRTPETDTNFQYLQEQISSNGLLLTAYRIVKDEPQQIQAVLDEMVQKGANIVLCNGGTGISKRDTTYDVLSSLYEKPLVGFGELFRMLSYRQVGASAMFSRASAGVYRECVVLSIPGSNAAVRLAWEELILPEIHHLAWEVGR